ncbi:Hint domain-containing protein, partial [Rhodoblastus sp.]|uniref:Hint domain-containing protein n=1 Tax=Rhodoblastus sp. TaxID=1962975 RepID=UPI00262C0ED3
MSGSLNSTSYVGSGTGNSGSDSGTTIIAGGYQYVGYSGGVGTATGTVIQGGYQFLGYGSGGTGYASSTTISAGAQYVGESGGTGYATSTTILNGGSQNVGFDSGSGFASNTTIASGGIQYVGIGSGASGTAITTTIEALATQIVGYVGNGSATDTTLSGGQQYLGYGSGTGTGIATNTIINNGGQQYVGYGSSATGVATNTTISGRGSQYVGDGGTGYATSTTIDSGGSQFVNSGGTAIDTTIYSGGLADVLSGGVINAPVIDGGTLQLAAGATIGSGGIDFAAVSGLNGGTLDLSGMGTGAAFTSDFTAVISGFTGTGGSQSASDEINVVGAGSGDYLNWSQGAGSGVLDVLNGGTVLESMTLAGTYSTNQFVLSNAGSVDEIFYNTSNACYCAGTRISTERGEIAVENLNIGDRLLTESGAPRPLKWIGTRSYSARFAGNNPDLLPIRFKAGSLDENVPARDLLVSPKHAMFLDGVLI